MQTSENRKQWLSSREASNYSGMGFSTLAKFRLKGGGPAYSKIGNKVVYSVQDIDDWFKSRRVANTSQYAA